MKSKILLIASILCLFSLFAYAQTNSPGTNQTVTLTPPAPVTVTNPPAATVHEVIEVDSPAAALAAFFHFVVPEISYEHVLLFLFIAARAFLKYAPAKITSGKIGTVLSHVALQISPAPPKV